MQAEDINLTDITSCTKDMAEGNSFLKIDPESGILPRFSKEITSVFLLADWPLFGEKIGDIEKPAQILKCYAALMPHGKMYVAEIFFISENAANDDANYVGSTRVFTIKYPNDTYDEKYDDIIMDKIALTLFGSGNPPDDASK